MRFLLNATRDEQIRYLLLCAIAIIVISSPAFAQAAGAVDPTSFLRKIIEFLTGTWGTLLGVIALIILGLSAMFGMFDIRKVGFWMLGIVMVFGAAWIMEQVTGKTI